MVVVRSTDSRDECVVLRRIGGSLTVNLRPLIRRSSRLLSYFHPTLISEDEMHRLIINLWLATVLLLALSSLPEMPHSFLHHHRDQIRSSLSIVRLYIIS